MRRTLFDMITYSSILIILIILQIAVRHQTIKGIIQHRFLICRYISFRDIVNHNDVIFPKE